ncbi:hypothetical protein [Telluribacter humicola]|uniref:hypothetical protein n=1 Tax=Telluribacter humicola TaxID=1720261 RepID=UPI001A972E6A|nr:hypothetical protein [Telluribacter humicola]
MDNQTLQQELSTPVTFLDHVVPIAQRFNHVEKKLKTFQQQLAGVRPVTIEGYPLLDLASSQAIYRKAIEATEQELSEVGREFYDELNRYVQQYRALREPAVPDDDFPEIPVNEPKRDITG